MLPATTQSWDVIACSRGCPRGHFDDGGVEAPMSRCRPRRNAVTTSCRTCMHMRRCVRPMMCDRTSVSRAFWRWTWRVGDGTDNVEAPRPRYAQSKEPGRGQEAVTRSERFEKTGICKPGKGRRNCMLKRAVNTQHGPGLGKIPAERRSRGS